jgi:anti-sigma B factor antagonist
VVIGTLSSQRQILCAQPTVRRPVSDIHSGSPDRYSSDDFTVRCQRIPAGVLVSASGEIDMDTAPALEQALLAAAEHTTARFPLLLDLREVSFLGSAGLNLMVACHQRCRAAGTSLVVVAPRRSVARVLRITAVDTVLNVVPELPGVPVNPA